jgi:hypothetical protein
MQKQHSSSYHWMNVQQTHQISKIIGRTTCMRVVIAPCSTLLPSSVCNHGCNIICNGWEVIWYQLLEYGGEDRCVWCQKVALLVYVAQNRSVRVVIAPFSTLLSTLYSHHKCVIMGCHIIFNGWELIWWSQ